VTSESELYRPLRAAQGNSRAERPSDALMSTHPNTAGWRFFALLAAVMIATFAVHELAHAAAGRALGHQMVMTLNNARPVGGEVSALHAALITAAGPLITVLQALVATRLALHTQALAWYAPVFAALFMRASAMLISLAHPNDEARLSLAAGLGTWTLPALTVGGLLWLAVVVSRQLRLHWSVQAIGYVVASLVVAAIVVIDRP
jgi:hypothetical protein